MVVWKLIGIQNSLAIKVALNESNATINFSDKTLKLKMAVRTSDRPENSIKKRDLSRH